MTGTATEVNTLVADWQEAMFPPPPPPPPPQQQQQQQQQQHPEKGSFSVG
jgi:hypothetical protein